MLRRPLTRTRRLLAAVSVSLAVAVGAGVAVPAADAAASDADACPVVSGQLTWGFKESFRAYISGTIANGRWDPIAPATYATPEFTWPQATGTFDPATGAGRVSFPGGVEFTGHDGLLDTTIAQPTLVLDGQGGAQLLLDVRGLSMEDALAGNTDAVETATQVPFADLTLGSPVVASDSFSATGVVATLAPEGAEAFGSYDPGTALDPAAIAFTWECPVAAAAEPTPAASPTTSDETPAAAPAVESVSAAWPLWTIGGVVVAAVIGLVVWLVVRRRGRPRADASDDAEGRP